MMKLWTAWMLSTLALCACGGETENRGNPQANTADEFALPAPSTPTEATKQANEAAGKRLPIGDRSDFEDANRGFLGAIESGVIKDDAGRTVWDVSRYAFLEGEAPPSVHPSLWRQAQLNAIHGLFEVVDGVYQLRGYDLSVMTLIRGDTGWIIVDPLLSRETAQAAFALAQMRLGERPVKAVIFTHSHGDHFGGVRGVVSDDDVQSGRVRIIAPEGFSEAAISENILAGNAMSRRARLQFGNDLPAGPLGQVDSGIGKALSTGVIGFMRPTETVKGAGEKLLIDGVEFDFVNAPDTEAPAEFMFYLPKFRALHTAELATGSLHNVLTMRGAKVRDALAWSKHIDDTISTFSDRADVVLASHNWPTWGKENVKSYLEHHRDAYRFIHDQTLRLANEGFTLHEIADAIGEPEFMREDFSVRGYYGTINHNAKATYQRYFGWWDGNPANLNPHPPVAEAERYVKLAGGAKNMLANAAAAYEDGDYRWTATVMNHLVFAEPNNAKAKSLLAGAYDQLGFQAESAIWRNYYLAAARELREGVNNHNSLQSTSSDFVSAIPASEYFDALAVRITPGKAKRQFIVNFTFDDTGEKFGVRVNDGIASHIAGGHFNDARVTVHLDRADLDAITLGTATFQGKIADGSIKMDGNPLEFGQFLLAHEQFKPSFNIVTP